MLEEILRLEIYLPSNREVFSDEITNLAKREHIASLALQRFLSDQISFSDYLDILELCMVDIDNYLESVDFYCANL